MTTDPAVEQRARPTTPPTAHPAAKFGAKATAAGWRVEYRAARGPLTIRRRPDEPDERGKYALVSVVEVVDTLGIRACHPDGRRIAAWWIGTKYGEGWAASPRSNAHALGIRALTSYLTETEEAPMPEPEKEVEPVGKLAEEARATFDERDPGHDIGGGLVGGDPRDREVFTRGYLAGHDAANERAGDAYSEGYAAGLAAVAGRDRVWVKTRKRLDALRPGDVLLGQGDRWWIVAGVAHKGREWAVMATSGHENKTVAADGQRKVDVVEPIALADALAALKNEDMGATPVADGGEAA